MHSDMMSHVVPLNEDALLLCDNEAVLRVIRKWVGQGGKATLATAPDVDILIKVKSHRGEPINERADTLAEEGRKFRMTQKVG